MTTQDVLELRSEPPRPQRRLTVLVRVVLAIPHLVVLTLLGYAAVIATFMAWFAAVFTGRNPFHRFVLGYLRWTLRVSAYLYLLTDRYPPFELGLAPQYPVDVDLAQGDLSRATVFFRLLLAIPALALTSLLRVGMAPLVFVAWLVTLVKGTLPTPLHQAFEASLRFDARTAAYGMLLQEPYPKGLFGDGEAAASATLPPPPVAPTPAAPTPAPAAPDASGAAALSYAWPPEVGAPAPPGDAHGASGSRVLLTRGARRLVITEIVLGVLGYVIWIPLVAVLVAGSLADRLWVVVYRGDVVTLSSAVGTARQELAASPPNWALLATTCGANGTVSQALSLFGPTTPAYPTAATNTYFANGLGWVRLATTACGIAVHRRDAALLPDVEQAFGHGVADLATFLRKIPT